MPTLVVFWFRDKAVCERLGGCGCSSGKAPRARPVACAVIDVSCVTRVAGAGAMVVGAAIVADERPDVGGDRVVAASEGDSVVVSGVLTEGEGGS